MYIHIYICIYIYICTFDIFGGRAGGRKGQRAAGRGQVGGRATRWPAGGLRAGFVNWFPMPHLALHSLSLRFTSLSLRFASLFALL